MPTGSQLRLLLWIIIISIGATITGVFGFWHYTEVRQALTDRFTADAADCTAVIDASWFARHNDHSCDRTIYSTALNNQIRDLFTLYPRFSAFRILNASSNNVFRCEIGAQRTDTQNIEMLNRHTIQEDDAPFRHALKADTQWLCKRVTSNGQHTFSLITPLQRYNVTDRPALLVIDMNETIFNTMLWEKMWPIVICAFLLLIVLVMGMIVSMFTTITGHKRIAAFIPSLTFALCGIFATQGLYIIFRNHDRINIDNAFVTQSARDSRIRDALTTLRDTEIHYMCNFLSNEKEIDTLTFNTMLNRTHGSSKIEYWYWIRAVSHANRAAYERTISTEFSPGVKIWHFDAQGITHTAPVASNYFPIVCITDPEHGMLFNAERPGFDILSLPPDAPIRKLIRDTSDSQLILASELQPANVKNGLGWHQFIAVRVNYPNSEDLKGFVIGVLDISRLLSVGSVIRHQTPITTMALTLPFPTSTQASAITASGTQTTIPLNTDDLMSIHPCSAFGRIYAIIVRPTDSFFATHTRRGGLLALVFGGLFTILGTTLAYLFRYNHTLLQSRLSMQDKTLRRTAMHADTLVRTSKSLSRRLQIYAMNSSDIFWESNLETHTFTSITSNIQDILGIPAEDVIGHSIDEFVPRIFRSRDHLNAWLESVAKNQNTSASIRNTLTLNLEELHATDGRVIWLELGACAYEDPGTHRTIASGVARVVTDRIRSEQYSRVTLTVLHALASGGTIANTLRIFTEAFRKETGVARAEFLYAGRADMTESDLSHLLDPTGGAAGYQTTTYGSVWRDSGSATDMYASCVRVPLFGSNQWLAGVFQTLAVEPANFDARAVSQLEFIISHIGEAIILNRAKAEREIAERELREIIDSVDGGIFRYALDNERHFNFISPNMLKMLGYTRDEFTESTGDSFERMIYHEDREQTLQAIETQIAHSNSVACEYRVKKHGGELMWVYHVARRVTDRHNKQWFYVYIVDISQRKQAEEESRELRIQLEQTAKMESVGRLAAGIAHDFNNMLQAVLGNAEIALLDVEGNEDARADILAIQAAARRAAELTSQLLLFARRSQSNPVALDLNVAIEKLVFLLRRMLGESIALDWKSADEDCVVLIDPTHLDQIMMNLCINARDAIGQRNNGRIMIRCNMREFTQPFPSSTGFIPPGAYATITVLDNGPGISPENITRIFEPFFSTKEKGKGTGLGLATIYGIVNACSGGISVTSDVGFGAAFEIFLPRSTDAVSKSTEASQAMTSPSDAIKPGGLILVVDDEPTLLATTTRMLETVGYTTRSTTSPREAVEIFKTYHDEICLVLSDVIMPELHGPAMVEQMRAIDPDIPFIYMSGYTDNLLDEQGVNHQSLDLIPKPFTGKTLAKRVAAAIMRHNEEPTA